MNQQGHNAGAQQGNLTGPIVKVDHVSRIPDSGACTVRLTLPMDRRESFPDAWRGLAHADPWTWTVPAVEAQRFREGELIYLFTLQPALELAAAGA